VSGVDQGLDRALVGDVEGGEASPVADGLDRAASPVLVDVAHEHVRSGRHELAGRLGADAGGSAGHHDHRARHVDHGPRVAHAVPWRASVEG
jgi:hypothetical protein